MLILLVWKIEDNENYYRMDNYAFMVIIQKGSKIMKKRLTSVILILLLMLFCTTAYAAPKVVLDGREISFDVPPVIEDGRTLVPLRAIFSALGADVKWDGYTQTVTAIKDNTNIKLIIGGKAYINFQPVDLDVPAKIIDGRTMVPLRFVTESLDCNVDWNKDTQTILLTSKSEGKSTLEAKPGYKVFETDDCAVRYPEKWEHYKIIHESEGYGVSFYYFYLENELNNKNKQMIMINIDKLKNVLSIEQYVDLSKLQAESLYGNFKWGKVTNTTLNGLPAKNMSFTGVLDGVPIKQTSIITVIGNNAYGVSLLEFGDVNPSLKDFEEAKNSFTIK